MKASPGATVGVLTMLVAGCGPTQMEQTLSDCKNLGDAPTEADFRHRPGFTSNADGIGVVILGAYRSGDADYEVNFMSESVEGVSQQYRFNPELMENMTGDVIVWTPEQRETRRNLLQAERARALTDSSVAYTKAKSQCESLLRR
ncbi:hypothetical protein ACFL1B_04715 [Nanoarchaeota archaeon]